MSCDIWQDFEKMRQDLTDNTHISRKALEAMLDAHKEVVAERDALAADVERLKQAGETLRHELAQWSLTERDPETTAAMCQFDHAARETPETSLARLKAQCRRDVVARLAEEFREAWPEHNGKHAWILGAGEDICRQAEEPTE